MNRPIFFTLLLSVVMTTSWAQSPPPPCGLSPAFVCDVDLDGEVIVDLTQAFPFSFCNVNPNQAPNYTMSYYLTQLDADSASNAIQDPENFIFNNEEAIDVFIRADANESDTVLIKNEGLITAVPPTPNTPTPLVLCDTNGNGFNDFNLISKRFEILGGESASLYDVKFYESFEDALNLNNAIDTTTDYINNVAYQQTIYASVSVYLAYDLEIACVEVVPLDLVIDTNCEDIAINLVRNSPPPRPGFTYKNRLFISNPGATSVQAGTVQFLYDDAIIYDSMVTSSSSLITEIIDGGFNISFTDLDADAAEFIDFFFTIPTDLELGTTIINSAQYVTNENDNYTLNDYRSITDTVIGSYDPNDIFESQGPEIVYDEFITSDEYLYYTIRFQNIGTAEAIDVSIENTLDNRLDPSTFQQLSASHSNFVLRETDKLTWTFSNINLPAEQDDAEGSNGFVHYRVKPHVGYAVGDVIPNSASIYFDFNAPIITNTFTTTFVELLSVNEFNSFNYSMYPNPACDRVIFEFPSTLVSNIVINLIDLQGKYINVPLSFVGSSMELNVSFLNPGLYFVKIKNGDKISVEKLIIK